MKDLERLRGRIVCLECGSKMVGWISSKKNWYCWDCGYYMTDDDLFDALDKRKGSRSGTKFAKSIGLCYN
jgi:transcription initiation factor TFIIIB Brf1 subunit/transcription initiation factor TFIIB